MVQASAIPPATKRLVEPSQVAMLVIGDEVYGIGTIEKLYAEAWPDMTFVCLGTGPLHDWLLARKANVELVPGLRRFAESRSLSTVAKMPLVFQQAKRDAQNIHERIAGRGIRIVHAQWRAQQIIAGYLRRFGYRAVWQINNTMNPRRLFGLGKTLNHRLAKWGADLLLPASDYIGANWQGCGVPIKTIRNAAVPLLDSPSALPLDGPVRAIVAGRIDPTKGHHVAIAAVAEARRQGCEVTLDVLGGPLDDNSYADELRKQIADSKLEGVVTLKGFCPDIREQHPRYHVAFQCRINPEPCSLWVCETMVDGLPIIASANGGTPELVADGESGYLVASGSVDELSRRLIELCRNRELLAKMRVAAFERGAKHFTLQRFANETLAAYATVA